MTRRAAIAGLPAAIVVLAFMHQASAQDTGNVQTITRDVQSLISNQSWRKAEERLGQGDAACPQNKSNEKCRLQLQFTRGFLKESESRTNPEGRLDLLRESAVAYQDVLKMAPGHEPTTHNLALVLGALGDTTQLENLLADPKPRSPALTSTIAVSLGDAQVGKGNWTEAYRAFARAVDLTDDTASKRKMIQSLESLSAVPDDMPDMVRSWELRSPAVAAEAYAAMFRKQTQLGDARAADSLVRWVLLSADMRALSAAGTEAALAGIDAPPVGELLDYLRLLEAGSDDIFADAEQAKHFTRSYEQSEPIVRRFPWWAERDERRHALGAAALSIGRASAASDQPVKAQFQFLVGLQVAPPIEEYIYNSDPSTQSFVPLDLVTELVWLQVRYPDVLDPERTKFDAFIRLLFEGKGEAYQSGDLVAIQRHHMVLGPIFADRGQWQHGRYQYDNAIFQLSQAVRMAERRERAEQFHQALPIIKAQLAEGYRAIGDAENELKARVDAVQGALDSDDLRLATEQLDALTAISPGQKPGPLGRQLREILASRLAARDGGTAAAPQWATADAIRGLDPAFVTRQQFKLLADLANAAPAADRRRALQAAWARAEQVGTLIGMEDVLRLERMATLGAGSSAERVTMKIVPGGRNAKAASGQWLLSLPSSDLPFLASLPAQ